MVDEPETPTQLPAKQTDDKPEIADQSASPAKKRDTRDIWAYIGKASALVGLLIGAITLNNSINPRGPHVTATCTLAEVSDYLKYGEEKALAKFRIILSTDSVMLAMPSEAGKAAHSPSVLKALSEKLSTFIPIYRSLNSIPDHVQALKCAIVNDGSEPAPDVQLHLPNQPVRVYSNKEEIDAKDFRNKAISLGTLPAGPSLNLEAWLETYSIYQFENHIFLNYRGGTGKVLLGQTYFGTASTLAHIWDNFGLFGLFLAVMMLLSIFISVISAIRQAQTNRSKSRQLQDK